MSIGDETTLDRVVTEDISDFAAIKNRSVKGIIAVTSRNFLVQLVAVVANFLFGIFLTPSEYGIFFGVSAVIEFFIIFSDVGLAAALIQKPDALTDHDLTTTFTMQQILVNGLVATALIFSVPIAHFYNLSPAGLWLFRALAISLTLASLKTIPAIKLERRLEFSKLIIPEIVENLIFYTTAVILAWKGFGVTSFSVAVLLRGFFGLIVIYWLSPWKPALTLHRTTLKKLFSFGIPFQANTIIAFVKDKLLIAYLFKVLSPREVGFIGWAQKWANYPLSFIMGPVNKVTFPAYSRVQHDNDILKKAIDSTVFSISLLVFPMVIGLVAIFPAFIRLFPRYGQWQPAIFSLSLFAIASLWAAVSTTLTNVLAAIGKIKTNLKLMVMWTVLTWALTPLLIARFGFTGAALASAIVSFTSIVPIIIVQRLVKTNVAVNSLPLLLNASIMGLAAFVLSRTVTSLPALFIVILLSVILYGGLSWVTQRQKLIHYSHLFLKTLS